jgi:predicted CxxxxCH...CXXCH cytochrome family protein
MNLWTSVLLAWVAVNLLLVGLMWRYQHMKERAARRRAAASPADLPHDGTPQSCPRAQAGWRCHLPAAAGIRSGADVAPRPQRQRFVAFTAADTAPSWGSPGPRAATACASCHVQELHDEIRLLKLTVAELALDKAMLSAAAAHRKAVS